MDKIDQRKQTFECSDLNLSASNNSCFFDSSKPADCLFEGTDKVIENGDNSQNCPNLNPSECNDVSSTGCSSANSTDGNLFNLRKKCTLF